MRKAAWFRGLLIAAMLVGAGVYTSEAADFSMLRAQLDKQTLTEEQKTQLWEERFKGEVVTGIGFVEAIELPEGFDGAYVHLKSTPDLEYGDITLVFPNRVVVAFFREGERISFTGSADHFNPEIFNVRLQDVTVCK